MIISYPCALITSNEEERDRPLLWLSHVGMYFTVMRHQRALMIDAERDVLAQTELLIELGYQASETKKLSILEYGTAKQAQI